MRCSHDGDWRSDDSCRKRGDVGDDSGKNGGEERADHSSNSNGWTVNGDDCGKDGSDAQKEAAGQGAR